jgi:dTDP-4-amino-4,6-dideoxygalactose transaminase
MQRLRQLEIGTQVHYIPVCDQPYYKRRRAFECPNAARFYACELSLPMYPSLGDSDVERVIDAVASVLEQPLRVAS